MIFIEDKFLLLFLKRYRSERDTIMSISYKFSLNQYVNWFENSSRSITLQKKSKLITQRLTFGWSFEIRRCKSF